MAVQKEVYEAVLAEERRIRQANEARQATKMAQMYNFVRGLSVQMGNSISPIAFPMAPASTTPPVRNLTTL